MAVSILPEGSESVHTGIYENKWNPIKETGRDELEGAQDISPMLPRIARGGVLTAENLVQNMQFPS